MTLFLGILLTFLVFFIVVLVHELGHFSLARLTGMKVLEFGFGIPPKLFRVFRDRKGTEYTVNALPIGGFVRIKGEDPMSIEAQDSDSFSKKKWWARAIVLLGGVTMNFFLAILILAVGFMVGISPIAPNFFTDKDYHSVLLPSPQTSLETRYLISSGVVLNPLSGSLAELSGILPGDIVRSVNGDANIYLPDNLITYISQNIPLTLELYGTGGLRTIELTPESGKIGVAIGLGGLDIDREYKISRAPLEALALGARETYVLSVLTLELLGTTVKNLTFPETPEDREEAKMMISGPIGIGAGFVSLVDIGFTLERFVLIIAMISISLGVFNLLPFPALDGGRFVTTTISSIVGRWYPDLIKLARIETSTHGGGMIILLFLSLLVAFTDITKLL